MWVFLGWEGQGAAGRSGRKRFACRRTLHRKQLLGRPPRLESLSRRRPTKKDWAYPLLNTCFATVVRAKFTYEESVWTSTNPLTPSPVECRSCKDGICTDQAHQSLHRYLQPQSSEFAKSNVLVSPALILASNYSPTMTAPRVGIQQPREPRWKENFR